MKMAKEKKRPKGFPGEGGEKKEERK